MGGKSMGKMMKSAIFVQEKIQYICRWRALYLLMLLVSLPLFSQGDASNHYAPETIFAASDRCFACHNGLTTPTGEDVSIGTNWRASMMANSARDPYWQASVRRETIDHPNASAAIEAECAVCHMPMSSYIAKAKNEESEVFAHLPFQPGSPLSQLAAEGVSCTVCHQIEHEGLGSKESFVGGFNINVNGTESGRQLYGPFQVDAGRTKIMRSSTGFNPVEGNHIQKSELCATCHTLYTKALGPGGEVIGELPEQVPYLEWLHSDFREVKSCQDCHMPVVADAIPITSVLGNPREGVSRHVFLGGNFFMLRMLNRYRTDLGVTALPQELELSAKRTIANLESNSAEISIDNVERKEDHLKVEVSIKNLAGHKLPTAYPSRRVWLNLVVHQGNQVIFESGAINEQGQILGNDNDSDKNRFEPHYTEINSSGQVQIYESIMADPAGMPTTGLLSAVQFVKDNRLLPTGFDKTTASKDIAVRGKAAQDPDFENGDRISYSIPLGNAGESLRVEARLWYQPISFRWAENLREYKAIETERFVKYYDAMSSASAIILARASTEIN